MLQALNSPRNGQKIVVHMQHHPPQPLPIPLDIIPTYAIYPYTAHDRVQPKVGIELNRTQSRRQIFGKFALLLTPPT